MLPVPRLLPPRPALALALAATMATAGGALGACGRPPQPLPTAPPPPSASSGLSSGLPSAQPGSPGQPGLTGLPGLPGGAGVTPPVGPLPTYPTLASTIQPTTRPSISGPKPAARCTSGPTGAQVLAVVKGTPGIPDRELAVHAGPYCSGSWQFTELELAGKTEHQVEPLLVVTTGKPAALTVVEAGADVCSDRVQHDAPPGIRVRACGL
jgi:hypothetical protein